MTANTLDGQKRETAAGTTPSPAAEAPSVPPTVMLDRANPEFLARAHDVYAELRALGPVVKASTKDFASEAVPGAPAGQAPAQPLYFVTQYDEVVEALLDDRIASDFRRGMTLQQRERLQAAFPEELRPLADSLILIDPPDHTRLRKLVQPSFTARAMDALKPRVQRRVDELMDKAERAAAERGEAAGERRMDFVESFAYPLPVQVISDMLGIPDEDQAQVHVWAKGFDPQQRLGDGEARSGMRAFRSYLDELFERKRRQPAEDMISQMLQAVEDGDRLNHQEMVSMVFLLFFAGHVTTVNLLGNGVVALVQHPEQHARVLADPAGTAKGLVEETLRYWGPVDFPGTPRTAMEDLTVGGVHVPKGSRMTVGLASANRDPKRFENPDAFDISRADAHRNVAFGKGIHVCLGAPLARLEGQLAFEALFKRWPKLRLAVRPDELRLGTGAAMRGFSHIPVLF